MAYLQQDAFDDIDSSMPRDRQLESFHLLKELVARDYRFKDMEDAREYFTRITGLYKNLNYSAPDSPSYRQYKQEIEQLANKYSSAV
jgi:V/A-type H+-transporting ATPase subunit A